MTTHSEKCYQPVHSGYHSGLNHGDHHGHHGTVNTALAVATTTSAQSDVSVDGSVVRSMVSNAVSGATSSSATSSSTSDDIGDSRGSHMGSITDSGTGGCAGSSTDSKRSNNMARTHIVTARDKADRLATITATGATTTDENGDHIYPNCHPPVYHASSPSNNSFYCGNKPGHSNSNKNGSKGDTNTASNANCPPAAPILGPSAQIGTRAALEDAKARATASAAHAAAAAMKMAYPPATTPSTAPALIVTSGTMVTTVDTTDTADIKVVADTTGNIDVIYLLGSQMTGVITGSTEKHGRDTTDGLFPPVMIDAIVLALEDALPLLLIQTITEDQLLAGPVHGTLSLEQCLDLPDAPPPVICSVPVRKPRTVGHMHKLVPPLRDRAMGSVWYKHWRKQFL